MEISVCLPANPLHWQSDKTPEKLYLIMYPNETNRINSRLHTRDQPINRHVENVSKQKILIIINDLMIYNVRFTSCLENH